MCLTKSGNRIKIIDFGLARTYEPQKKLQVNSPSSVVTYRSYTENDTILGFENMFLFHFCDFPIFTKSTNLQIISK